MASINSSTDRRYSSGSRKAATSTAITMAFCACDWLAGSAMRGTHNGLPARRLDQHSNIMASPEPFGPKGSQILALLGSVVSLPSLSSAQPFGIGMSLVGGEVDLAAGRDAGRHVEHDRRMPLCRDADRNGAVVKAGCLGSVRRHVRGTAHGRHPDQAFARDAVGVIRERAVVGATADHDPRRAARTCLGHGVFHTRHGGDGPGRAVRIDQCRGRGLPHDFGHRVGNHVAVVDLPDVPRDAQHTVRVDAPDVGPDEHVRLAFRVRGGHPGGTEDRGREVRERAGADGHAIRMARRIRHRSCCGRCDCDEGVAAHKGAAVLYPAQLACSKAFAPQIESCACAAHRLRLHHTNVTPSSANNPFPPMPSGGTR